MRKSIVGIAATFLYASAAYAGPKVVLTPSGMPDVVFKGASIEAAVGKVANGCMNRGWQVSSQTTNQVVCEIPQNMGRQVLQQLLLGNAYSTTPKTFIRVSLAAINGDVRAQAVGWTETQMAFGQVQQHQYDDDNSYNGFLSFLVSAGGELPEGTRFNGMILGVKGELAKDGKKAVYRVSSLRPGYPAAQAGMLENDVITKVNGHTFKSDDEFLTSSSDVQVGSKFPIVVNRGGKSLTLSVAAVPFPAVGTPQYKALGEASSTDAQGTPSEAAAPVAGEGENEGA